MGRTPTGKTRRKVFEFVRDRLLTGPPPTVREVVQGPDLHPREVAGGALDSGEDLL